MARTWHSAHLRYSPVFTHRCWSAGWSAGMKGLQARPNLLCNHLQAGGHVFSFFLPNNQSEQKWVGSHVTLPVHLSGVPQKVSVHFVSQLNISNALNKSWDLWPNKLPDDSLQNPDRLADPVLHWNDSEKGSKWLLQLWLSKISLDSSPYLAVLLHACANMQQRIQYS